MKDFWKKQTKKGPLACLAPMDWYTDSAYRQIVKSVNPDVFCFTEFYSADWLVHSPFLKDQVLPHKKIEEPLIVQIFWKDPEMFAKAAKIIEQYNVAWIDVNMWCPAKKVVRSGHGSSLMINTDTAFKIIEELNKATKLPVSVKTRLWFNNDEDLIPFAKWLENAGASLLTVHGRTTAQAYTGKANFEPIYELKNHLNIPVIWNGDVINYDNWIAKLNNLDGFMIGRWSFWNPWCFLPNHYKPTLKEVLDMMLFHSKALEENKWEKRASLEIRKHLVQYLHSFPWVKEFRKELVTVESVEATHNIIEKIRWEYSDFLGEKLEDIKKASS